MKDVEYLKEFIGETLGTFILTLFGCGSVAVAVLFGEYNSIFQIGMVWGIGVTLAIYLTRHLSNAHLNPAVTIAMVIAKRMKASKTPVYLTAQFLGAFLAGWAVFMLFSPSISAFENLHEWVRGSEASIMTAKIFGEFYPNPGGTAVVSLPLAMGAEFFGTFLLLLAIFGLTEDANAGRPDNSITPLFIGLTVSSVIWLIAPLTQAGINPARDFAPRMVAWMAGWGKAAFPDNCGGFFWVYILSPVAGGITAAVCEPFIKRITTNKKETMCIMKTTKIIVAGGFLGAGKTTLLWNTAQYLMQKGLKVGLITNDQAPELVDTALLKQKGLTVAEVNGSCFCCNFNGFIQAAQSLREKSEVDVIIAEPVGSCTDLSATIIQPLKKYWNEKFDIAPLTVLSDPARLASILDGGNAGLHEDAAYIYRKQLEESDIILITKSGKYSPEFISNLKNQTTQAYPLATVLAADSISGKGLNGWTEEAMLRKDSGLKIAEIDYDVYAHGEAVLGWLNGTLRLQGENVDWNIFFSQLLEELPSCFNRENCSVGHVKLIAENGNQYIAGNITGNSPTPAATGFMENCDEIRLTINARVETSPENLNDMVRNTLDSLVKNRYSAHTLAWRCLSPGRPNPTYRFTAVC